MAISFETTISDRKFDFIEETALRNEIIKSGRKRIVFVEGYDDKIIFEIVFSEYKDALSFIDVSLEIAKRTTDITISAIGGCETVKTLLSKCVSSISQEKRFYGIIDRDLKQDDEIESEILNPCYDAKLFVFKERYTIENYFITSDILYEFIKGRSIKHKDLIPLLELGQNNFEIKILTPIEVLLIDIGAGNLTIRFFDLTKGFLEPSIKADEIENRVTQRLSDVDTKENIIQKLEEFKSFINESEENTHKFASGKLYASYNFNLKIQEACEVNLQITQYKAELARILKEKGLPNDFNELLLFLTHD